MATTIRIDGTDIIRLKRSLSVQNGLERRSTASFVIVDEAGTGTYQKGQPVEIFTNWPIPPFIHPLFSGYINGVKRKRISPVDSKLFWAIDCIDNHYLADKRIAAEAYTTQTAGFIVDDLYTKYLAPEGVVLGTIEAGPTIAEMVINYRSVSDALDALAAKSDKIWEINRAKELNFVDRSTSVAPFAIITTDILRDPGIASELAENAPLYRNRQYKRAGRDITTLQTENRTGDGDTQSFAMGYPLASEPTVTVAGAPQTMGIKGIDTACDAYWATGDSVITFTVAPGAADAVVFQYYGLYDIMVMVDDLVEQLNRQAVEGGTGINESMDDDPSINDTDDALAAALAQLDYYGVIGKQFSFPINQWGLEPGQLVTVTHAPYGLNLDQLLVESVSISELAPNNLRYDILAVEGPEMGDWTGFFKSLADIKDDILDRITVGSDKILIIMTDTEETIEIDETITETVYACPIPSVTLFPSATLYPC